jgi:hypothetical protein
MMTLSLLVTSHTPSYAATVPARVYQPGDIVQMEAGVSYRIISINGTGEWDDCEVQPLLDGKPSAKPGRMTIRNLRAGEERLAKSRSIAKPAVTPPRIYKPGDIVQMEGSEAYRIISVNGTGEWDDCEVQPLKDGKPSAKPLKMSIRNLRAGEERLAKSRGIATPSATTPVSAPASIPAPAASAPPTVAPQKPASNPTKPSGPAAGADGKWRVGDRLEVNERAFWYPAQILEIKGDKYKVHYDGYPASDDKWVTVVSMRPLGGYKVAAACNFDPPGPAVTAKSQFSEALAKRKIFDEYGWKANGSLSAPVRVGVTFLAFEVGKPYQNTVENVPGRGAQRRHAGAPPNATIYTLKSKHMVCEEYRDGSVKRRLVEGSYGCFISKDGEWTCPSESDTKISQLE